GLRDRPMAGGFPIGVSSDPRGWRSRLRDVWNARRCGCPPAGVQGPWIWGSRAGLGSGRLEGWLSRGLDVSQSGLVEAQGAGRLAAEMARFRGYLSACVGGKSGGDWRPRWAHGKCAGASILIVPVGG